MEEKNLQLERLVFFCDAVVAIAITLLVFNLKIEHTAGAHLTFADTIKPWKSFFAFGLSFINIASFWKTHHVFFSHIRKVDERLMRYNLTWLFFIVLLPFSTSTVGTYLFDTPAIFIYSLNTFMVSMMQNLIWDYASDKPEYLKENTISESTIKRLRTFCNLDMLNAIIAIGISFFFPLVAFIFLYTKLPMILVASIFLRKEFKEQRAEWKEEKAARKQKPNN